MSYEFDALYLAVAEPTVDMTLEEIVFNYIATPKVQEKISRLRTIAEELGRIDDSDTASMHQLSMRLQLDRLNNFLIIYEHLESDGHLENITEADRFNLAASRPRRPYLEMVQREMENMREIFEYHGIIAGHHQYLDLSY